MYIVKSDKTRMQIGKVENQDIKDYMVTFLNNYIYIYILKLKKPKTPIIQTTTFQQQQLDQPLMVPGSNFCGFVARISFE